ncbi:MAG: TPM domain-containing protein [Clostridiales bacterium]|nr:TPM domain-containing protein [Clostridiales bacterium]
MKNTRKSLFSIFIALVILFISATPAFALVEKTEDFYVADYAQVLSEETKNKIISQNELLYEQTGGQIVVVTVRYLEDGYYADEYAVKLFNDWGVGDSQKNNGILLLLVTEECKGWLTQGSGIKDDLTNDKIDDMLEDYFWKKFDSGDFDGAVDKLFSKLIDWYEDTYNFRLGDGSYVDNSYNSGSVPNNSGTVSFVPGVVRFVFKVMGLIVLLVIIIVICSLTRPARRRRRRGFWAPPPPPPPPIMGPRPPRNNFHNNSFRNSGNSFHSGGGGRSGGSGGGRSGGFHSGGGGRSGGGGAGRR